MPRAESAPKRPRFGCQRRAPEAIKSKLTRKTRVIMPVHLFGQLADMEAINQIALTYTFYNPMTNVISAITKSSVLPTAKPKTLCT